MSVYMEFPKRACRLARWQKEGRVRKADILFRDVPFVLLMGSETASRLILLDICVRVRAFFTLVLSTLSSRPARHSCSRRVTSGLL